jgi:lactonase
MNPDGSGFTTVWTGEVDGATMVPDDIAFDAAGDMYVSDYRGTIFNPVGRIVRFDPTGKNPVVVQGGLVSPNGISFTPDYSALWVGELPTGKELHLTLAADGKSVAASSIGMTANLGAGGGFDSNSIDADGNVYQCNPGSGRILVWNTSGDLVATVVVPQSDFPIAGQTVVTNLAIKKGTRDAYVTVGGPNGGYIYHFTALAPGIAQSNGGH